ncbi:MULTISPECIES: YfzA family protein [Heyndrickxia]|jgi:paired small multidrug resistance pump|uniref:YfzA family protein n=1 Tax=Heyndrickxia coagulans TaxID=1398 RepID=A0AAW7CMC5_HEYCO|nr:MULTISPECIES: YfzA family protein [Heyndrickxia]NWN93229.1 hypothetical protein [Bacillus sp. (in: firmicutes)]AVD57090.1 hypothetical protein C3766_13870 [Heyndrickxia coagulans]KGT38085.1 hypothetical protein P421_11845 [Heyndrickxia coagulans P38]MCI1576706.1 YfzA family protein [Heyndrickxia coagulans]MDL5042247.1 YfzA family protein [Heyndrickxia coagulans]
MAKAVKNGHANAAKKRYGWYIHLLIFVLAQLVFFIFDNVSASKNIFNLNDYGKWSVSAISPIYDWLQIYKSPQFNLIFVIWGAILIIDGLIRMLPKRHSYSQ